MTPRKKSTFVAAKPVEIAKAVFTRPINDKMKPLVARKTIDSKERTLFSAQTEGFGSL
jgi:hypothetical protein